VNQDAVDLLTFSADGQKVAWVAELGCHAWTREIYTADVVDGQVDTNSIVRVTNDQIEDTAPALSPDGRLVAYASSYNPAGYDPPFHVFIQRSNGRGPRAAILKDFFRAYPAAWAP
jgi:Tol biopolymer transport system component